MAKNYTQEDLKKIREHEFAPAESRRLAGVLEELMGKMEQQIATRRWADRDLMAEIAKTCDQLEALERSGGAPGSIGDPSAADEATGRGRKFKRGADFEIFQPGEPCAAWADTREWDRRGKSYDEYNGGLHSVGEYVVARMKGDQRAVQMGIDTDGGFLFSESISSRFVDKVRAKSVLGRLAPVITFPNENVSNLVFIEQTADASAYWRPETTAITASQPTFGTINSDPLVVAALCEISEEAILRSRNGAEIVTNALTSALALEIDRAGLRGVGAAGEPTGVTNWPGIHSTDKSGAALAPDDLLDWGNTIEVANGPELRDQTMVSTPTAAGWIRKLKDLEDRYLSMPDDWTRMKKLYSNQLRSNLGSGTDGTEFLYGDFSQMAMVSGLQVRVEIGAVGDSFQRLTKFVRAWAMVDFVVFRPAFFHHVYDVGAPS